MSKVQFEPRFKVGQTLYGIESDWFKKNREVVRWTVVRETLQFVYVSREGTSETRLSKTNNPDRLDGGRFNRGFVATTAEGSVQWAIEHHRNVAESKKHQWNEAIVDLEAYEALARSIEDE